MALKITIVLGLAVLALYGPAYADAGYTDRTDVREYAAELAVEHGFSEPALLELLGQAQRQAKILESIARPAERRLEWHEYRNIFLKEPRISQGLAFWAANEATLNQAQERYGVAPEYIVAILGVETRYGAITGGYRVLDALMTLAFDYPPRAAFFRGELTQYLLLAREEGRDPLWFVGSYAGAMGYGQFIPSSYRAYAVDFDGDGLRDIWTNEADAIGSVANYFSRHGWSADQPVAIQVELVNDAADAVANESLKPKRTIAEIRALGVTIDADEGLADDDKAGLYRMALADRTEYWLGLNNFYVITRYNHSRLYALAVHQLSQEILQGRLPIELSASP